MIVQCKRTVDDWKGFCPIYGRPFTKHGTYPGKTPWQFFSNLRIQRVICKGCKVTHALLPYFLLPYARYFAADIELAINPRVNKTLTLEQLAELIDTEICTIVRWRLKFKTHAQKIYHFLVRKLASKSLPESKWLRTSPPGSLECKLFELIAFLWNEPYKEFAFCDLASIGLLFPLDKMAKCPVP